MTFDSEIESMSIEYLYSSHIGLWDFKHIFEYKDQYKTNERHVIHDKQG